MVQKVVLYRNKKKLLKNFIWYSHKKSTGNGSKNQLEIIQKVWVQYKKLLLIWGE
mgnify:CR=1 FL=1